MKIYYYIEKRGTMNEVLEQILKVCEERYLGPNKMDRKHIISYSNETLDGIKQIIETYKQLK